MHIVYVCVHVHVVEEPTWAHVCICMYSVYVYVHVHVHVVEEPTWEHMYMYVHKVWPGATCALGAVWGGGPGHT